MDLNRFVNANIDMSDLTKLNLLERYILPEAGCKLLKFNPTFIDEIVKNQWKTILKDQLPPDVSFDDQTFTPYSLFGELLRIALRSHQSAKYVRQVWGFDILHLPDIKYLLGAIAVWDPESPIIRALPRKNQELKSELQENYEKAKMAMVLSKLATGQPIRTRIANEIPKELAEYLKKSADLSSAYFLVHVARKEQLNQAGRFLALSKTDEGVRAVMQEDGYLQLLTSADYGLSEEERGQAKSLIRAMEIEPSNLPAQDSNRSPYGPTPRGIERAREVLHERSEQMISGKEAPPKPVPLLRNLAESRFGDTGKVEMPIPSPPTDNKDEKATNPTTEAKPTTEAPKDNSEQQKYRPRVNKPA